MAELMGDTFEGDSHGVADALLTVGDHAGDRHRQDLPHLVDQAGQVLGRGRQQALGQEDLAGEAVAQHPEDLVADIRLQAVDGQDDAALRAQQRTESLGIGRGQGPQLVVAVQQVGDGAFGQDEPAVRELAVDLGDAAVLGIAEPADQRHDVESELMIRQGEVGLGLGPIGAEEAGAGGIGAASDGQGQSEDAVESTDGAIVIVVGIGPVLAFGAVKKDRRQGQGPVRLRAWSLSSFAHGWIPPGVRSPLSTLPEGFPATFASLVFFRQSLCEGLGGNLVGEGANPEFVVAEDVGIVGGGEGGSEFADLGVNGLMDGSGEVIDLGLLLG